MAANYSKPDFRFVHTEPSQRALLHRWFEQKHIKEWMHGVGLQNTLNGLEKFFQGKTDTTYWVGYDQDLVVTHKFLESDPFTSVSFSFNLRENNEQQRMGSKAVAGGGVRR
jgi:hypothetical protein